MREMNSGHTVSFMIWVGGNHDEITIVFSAQADVVVAMAATAAQQTPQAYRLQGSPVGFVVYNATTQYLGAALNGELTLDEAMAKIQEDLDANANN